MLAVITLNGLKHVAVRRISAEESNGKLTVLYTHFLDSHCSRLFVRLQWWWKLL